MKLDSIHARDAAKICEQIFDKTFENNYTLLSGHEDIRISDLLETISEMFSFKIKSDANLIKEVFITIRTHHTIL